VARACQTLVLAANFAALSCGDDAGTPPPGEPPSIPPQPTGGFGGQSFGRAGDGNAPWAGREAGSDPWSPGPDAAAADSAPASCPETPTAYLFEFQDPYTGSPGMAGELLAQAGFEVKPLPFDRDPTELRGLIFVGSFASESPVYREYVSSRSRNLYQFINAGNVLVQMTQADQTEPLPMFLHMPQNAVRGDPDVGQLYALDRTNPLLRDVPLDDAGALIWRFPQIGWETFLNQRGFQVVLAGGLDGKYPALLEAAPGAGRVLLSAMPADKPVGSGPDRDAFNRAFFRNLRDYARSVCRGQARTVTVTPPVDLPHPDDTSFMLAVLPDTQYYSNAWPGIYTAQTSWIAANAQRRKIAYVLHLGDLVDQNNPLEWERAAEAMWLLEGIVPYALVPGNHDLGPYGNAANRVTLLNQYFSYERTAAWPTFGGGFEGGKMENTYHLFSAGGRDYIIMALEWGPRDAVVTWADGVMARNPGRYGILVTHAYMNNNDFRYDIKDTSRSQLYNPHQYGTEGGVNDGEELWQKLVRRHPFVMTLNGHVLGDGTGYLASVTDKGNTCHQMLSNYQFRNLGGEGYMRLLEFLSDGKTVKVYTYSALYDTFLPDADQNLTLTLDVPLGPPPGAPATSPLTAATTAGTSAR
jgi:3',5'-cyclic AMP phosphodiesterase CpdA